VGFPAAAGEGLGANDGGRLLGRGKEEIGAAVFAEMKVVGAGERSGDAGRDAEVAVGAHAVVDDGDGFAALTEEAQEVGEDGRGNLDAQVFEERLAVGVGGGRRAELLLSGVERFEECSHYTDVFACDVPRSGAGEEAVGGWGVAEVSTEAGGGRDVRRGGVGAEFAPKRRIGVHALRCVRGGDRNV
jgi:hypothetical protein